MKSFSKIELVALTKQDEQQQQPSKTNRNNKMSFFSGFMDETLETIEEMRKNKEFILAQKTLEALMTIDDVKEDKMCMDFLKTYRGVLIRDIQSVLIKLREEKKKWRE